MLLLETNLVASRVSPNASSSSCSPPAAHCASSPGPLCALETESSSCRGALPAVQMVRALLRSNPPSKAYRDAFADQEEMYELAAHGLDEGAHELENEHERDGASDCLEPDELVEKDEEHEHEREHEEATSTASLSPRSTSSAEPSAKPAAKTCSSRSQHQSTSSDDSASYYHFYQCASPNHWTSNRRKKQRMCVLVLACVLQRATGRPSFCTR